MILNNFIYVHQLFRDNHFISYEYVKSEIGPYGGLIFDYNAVKSAVLKHLNIQIFQIYTHSATTHIR